MNTRFKKLMGGLVGFCLINTMLISAAYAADNQKTTISLKMSIDYSKDDQTQAKQWMKSVLDNGKAKLKDHLAMEQDVNEQKKMQHDFDLLDKQSAVDLFTDNADGSTSMIGGFPFIEVKMGDHIAATDANSQFTVTGLTKGDYPISLSYQGVEIYNSTVTINNLNQENIVFHMSSDDFGKAAEQMQERMSQSVNNAAQAQNIYFPTYTTGNPVPWAVSPGSMKVAQYDNFVSCNKADIDTGDGHYDTQNFPDTSADCADSLGYGILYSLYPSSYANYYMSYYCYLEGINHMLGESNNPYCNGQWKSDGHINCSWFYGVWCAERLHAHN